MKSFNRNHFIVLTIGLAALSFFVAHYFHPTQNPFGLGSDTYEYWHLSETILKHQEFAYTDLTHYPLFEMSDNLKEHYSQQRIPCMVRMPGYPFILACLRLLWNSPWVGLIFFYICYVGICLYGFLIGKLFFQEKFIQWIYNILLVLSPVYLTRWGVGSDFPAGLFMTGFAYHFLCIFNDPNKCKQNILPICLWGVASVFTRPNLIIFIFIFMGAAFIYGIVKKQRNLLYLSLILFITISSCLGLWMLRNKNICGQYLLSNQGGFVFYAVHLSYDLAKNDSLYYWHKQGKEDFFQENQHLGTPFNEIENQLNIKLKNVVLDYYKQQPPFLFIKKWIDGLRTLFMFSYYDISDLIIHLSDSDSQRYELGFQKQPSVQNILFQMSRFYKMLLGLSFFSMPFFIFKNRTNRYLIISLYLAVLASILSVAVFTGAAGDRMRMPFNVFLILYLVVFLEGMFKIIFKK